MLSKKFFLQALLLLLVSQQACGLVPEPRIEDSHKNSLQNEIQQGNKYNASKSKYEPKSSTGSSPTNEEAARKDTSRDDEEDDDNKRLVIIEPYKSLIQHSLRFALAQSNVVNYMQIDTIMDLMSDTGYMLASPHMLKRAIQVASIIGVSVMTLVLFVPRAYWKWISAEWVQSRGRLLEIERYLPNGLNEMGIISMLEEKTEEMLARFELNNSACRRQSVCQAGELLRCAFPKSAKSLVNFISENFSRPRYRDHEYIGSFLKGFIDLNCAANTDMDQSRSCLSSYIKSVSSCVKPDSTLQSKPAPAQESTLTKHGSYQILQVARA